MYTNILKTITFKIKEIEGQILKGILNCPAECFRTKTCGRIFRNARPGVLKCPAERFESKHPAGCFTKKRSAGQKSIRPDN